MWKKLELCDSAGNVFSKALFGTSSIIKLDKIRTITHLLHFSVSVLTCS